MIRVKSEIVCNFCGSYEKCSMKAVTGLNGVAGFEFRYPKGWESCGSGHWCGECERVVIESVCRRSKSE